MSPAPWTHGNRLVGYDRHRRRLWIGGQRVHHGLTGVLLAATGAVLMLHDRRDAALWFERGTGSQP